MNPIIAREAEAAEFGRELRGFGINLLGIFKLPFHSSGRFYR